MNLQGTSSCRFISPVNKKQLIKTQALVAKQKIKN